VIRIFSQYVSSKSILLVILEGILIAVSMICAVKVRFWNDPGEFEFYTVLPDFAAQTLFVVITFQICFYYNDLYNLNAIQRRGEQVIRLGQSLGAACLMVGFLYFLFPTLLVGRGVFFITMLLAAASIMLTRVALDAAWRVRAPAQRVLILGEGEMALNLARELARREDLSIKLVGFVKSRPNGYASDQIFGHRILGSVDQLEAIAREHQISRIVVAMEDRRGALPIRDLVKLRVQGTEVEEAHTAMAALTGRVWLATLRPSWFVFSDGFHRSRLTIILKRAIDLSLGLVGLILSAPLMALTALAVWLDSRGPVLYRQVRVGLSGKQFELLKFRSMRPDAEDANGAQWAEEEDPRATRVGRFLRNYRLDELPQFLNVVRGDMSFVGPRPERPVFVEKLREVIPYYDERHSVRPGVTGWAQVSYHYGRSLEDACRKLEYDLFYLKNMSILFDCAIAFQTVRIVLFGRGGR